MILNRDPGCHLEGLKTTPPIEEVATTCVECGFCEPVCPSRDLTTTPRQRIVLRREMARQPPGSPLLAELIEEYEYDGLETCAADGMCALACPLGIDTGVLVKELRARRARRARGTGGAAGRAALGPRRARRALRPGGVGELAGGRRAGRGARHRCARRLIGPELVPGWGRRCRRPPPAPPPTVRDGAAAVYLPACVNRMFGRDPAAPPPTPTPPRRVAAGGLVACRPGRAAPLDPDRGRG